MDDIMTIEEAAKYIGLAYSTLAQAVREGRVGPLKDGRVGARRSGSTWLIRIEALEEALEAGRIRPRRREEK
jgi:excisionase family DNA binding protein